MDKEIRYSHLKDAAMIAQWLLEDQNVLAHFLITGEIEAMDFAKNLVEGGDQKSCLIYEKQGKPCAFATMFVTSYIKLKHHAQLFLFVQKCDRNQGIGSILLSQLVQRATELQLEYIDLELYENPYVRFFENRGFKSYATQARYLKMDHGYLARTLYRKIL